MNTYLDPIDDGGPSSALLRDLQWLAALAHRIVGDAGLADDACQEAWLAASQGGVVAPSRPGLFRALRRFVWRARRSDRRRTRREAVVARTEGLPSTDALLLRGEQQQRLWQAVVSLAEPFRSTLLLRFQEGLSIATIAERQGTPRDTVRWRVRRGLTLLRTAISKDTDGGGIAGLAFAVPGFIRASDPAAVPPAVGKVSETLGWISMTKSKSVFSAVVFGILVASAWIWSSTAPFETARDSTANDSLARDTARRSQPIARRARRTGEIREVARRRANSATNAELHEERVRIIGRVVAESGRARAGVRVWLDSYFETYGQTRTDADGRFDLDAALPICDGRSTLHIAGGARMTHHTIRFGDDRSSQFAKLRGARYGTVDVGLVTLHVAGGVSGRCIDEDGMPIPRAHVAACGLSTTTGEGGRFRLDRLPIGSADVSTGKYGFLDATVATEIASTAVVEVGDVVLARAPSVSGHVTDRAGNPIPEATLNLRGVRRFTSHSRAVGAFEAALTSHSPTAIRVSAPGFIGLTAGPFAPGTKGIQIRLARDRRNVDGVRCRLRFIDARTGEVLQTFGAAVGVDQGSEANKRSLEYVHWLLRAPRPTQHKSQIFTVKARPGIDKYCVRAPGYVTKKGAIEETAASESFQTVRLEPAPRIVGRIVRDGVGVGGVLVELRPGELCSSSRTPNSELRRAVRSFTRETVIALDQATPEATVVRDGTPTHSCMTDDGGAFCFPRLQPGVYQLAAMTPRSGAWIPVVGVEAGAARDVGDLPLQPLGAIQGTLVATGAGSLAGHRVSIDGTKARAETDRRGNFVLDGLAAGVHVLRLAPGRGLLLRGSPHVGYSVRIEAGKARRLELRPDTLPSALVTITSPRHAGLHVTFSPEHGDSRQLRLDSKGTGTITLPASRLFRIVVHRPGSERELVTAMSFSPGASDLEL